MSTRGIGEKTFRALPRLRTSLNHEVVAVFLRAYCRPSTGLTLLIVADQSPSLPDPFLSAHSSTLSPFSPTACLPAAPRPQVSGSVTKEKVLFPLVPNSRSCISDRFLWPLWVSCPTPHILAAPPETVWEQDRRGSKAWSVGACWTTQNRCPRCRITQKSSCKSLPDVPTSPMRLFQKCSVCITNIKRCFSEYY